MAGRLIRLSVAALALVLCVTASSCGSSGAGPPQYSDTTLMGEIQNRGVLRVGVLPDSPPFAFAHGNSARGFEVDWARSQARSLGVRMKVTAAPLHALIDGVESGNLDMAFPNLPVTESEIKPPKNLANSDLPSNWPTSGAQFVDPFWVGHQRLLVPAGSGVRQLADLAGKKVCAVLDPETEPSPDKIEPDVKVVAEQKASGCVPLLRSGKVAAATSSDISLMAMMAALNRGPGKDFVLAGDQLSTEGYGILVSGKGSAGWLEHLNSFYGSTNPQDHWVVLYDKWLKDYSPMSPPIEAPTMTVGEAASLFPNQ